MRTLSAAELLDAWESGLPEGPVERALTLLAVAYPEKRRDELERLSAGQRDACLLTLRERTFGPKVACLTSCRGCGEHLDLSFTVADTRAAPGPEPPRALELEVARHEVRFRLPDSRDLAALAGDKEGRAGGAAARRLLLQRCILAAQCDGEERSVDQLAPEILDAVEKRMAQEDSQAVVRLALSCPVCGHQWEAIFDIGSFLWSEIHTWACRILREVHILASTYGWREAEILALSPWRRRFYLEMAGR
jgi:hypothetical protein